MAKYVQTTGAVLISSIPTTVDDTKTSRWCFCNLVCCAYYSAASLLLMCLDFCPFTSTALRRCSAHVIITNNWQSILFTLKHGGKHNINKERKPIDRLETRPTIPDKRPQHQITDSITPCSANADGYCLFRAAALTMLIVRILSSDRLFIYQFAWLAKSKK